MKKYLFKELMIIKTTGNAPDLAIEKLCIERQVNLSEYFRKWWVFTHHFLFLEAQNI